MPSSRLPVLLRPDGAPRFPNPLLSGARGLVAVGGALTPEWLLAAYQQGVFPWYDEETPKLWWSPDPRAILEPESLHISRSMRRFLRVSPFRLTHNRDFVGVMRGCAEDREDGTWILPEMLEAYTRLHRLGHAHSLEVWDGQSLVGGLYGVQRGALFAAESMFHRVTNASKLALIGAVLSLFRAGIRLFDVQFVTPHLASLGAYEIPRRDYLSRVGAAAGSQVDLAGLEAFLERACLLGLLSRHLPDGER